MIFQVLIGKGFHHIVTFDGTCHAIEATVGLSLMENAVRHSITGIVAECGGACSRATCHAHID